MITPSSIREDTVTIIEALVALQDFTIYNAPMTSIPEVSVPSVSVYLLSESAESLYHRDPAFSVTFDLVLELAYKAGVDGNNLSKVWADEINDAENAILDALMTNATWLDQFDEVQGYSIERELISDASYLMATSSITFPCQLTVCYEANR